MPYATDNDLIAYVVRHGPVETETVQRRFGGAPGLIEQRLVALAIGGSVRRRQTRDGIDLWSRRGRRTRADIATARPGQG